MSDPATAPPPPPPMGPPPPGGDIDRGHPLIAIYWAQMFFAVTIVTLRMYSRWVTRSIGADDWWMLVSLFFQIVLAAFVTQYALIGGTRHLYYLTPVEMKPILMWNYAFQCWGIFACTPTKVSVALLINRIMRPFRGWRFWLLVVSITLVALINTLDSIFTYTQCNPAKALWDKTITDAKCWDPSIQANISIAQASYNVFVDALLAILPATLLWKLKIPTRRKISLCILLGLGLVAAIAGSIKTSLLAKLSARSDLTWEMYHLIIWAGTENFVVLFCGSVPPLKPLYDKLFGSKDGKFRSMHFSFSRGTKSDGSKGWSFRSQSSRSKITNDDSLIESKGASARVYEASKQSSISLTQVSQNGNTARDVSHAV